MVSCKRSRRFLQPANRNFLVQVLDRLTQGEELLDSVFSSAEKIVKDIRIRGSLGCNNHALVEFMISRNADLTKSGVRTPNFRRVNLRLFKELLDEIPVKLSVGM